MLYCIVLYSWSWIYLIASRHHFYFNYNLPTYYFLSSINPVHSVYVQSVPQNVHLPPNPNLKR